MAETSPDSSPGHETTPQGDCHDVELEKATHAPVESGVTTIEAAQAIWGKSGRWFVIAGLAMIMIIYEIDNSTVYIYNNYSTSSFNALSHLATLGTATSIMFAVVKPPVAKLSNVIGRGQTYLMTISFYVLSYILMASATSFSVYATGAIFYSIGQSGTNIMNDVVVSDITTARWRAFAIGFTFFPFLITPWVAAYIVSSVVSKGGIGWRWGIGMFAILMPFCASFIITTLLYYQHRAKKLRLVPEMEKMTVYKFCSQIDLGGSMLFAAGFALVLVPLTLAATTPSQWRTAYLDALIAVGGVLLIGLFFYEKYVAAHPIMPTHYFRNLTIVLCLFMIATDSLAFGVTHSYLYAWSTTTHNFSVKVATFFQYTNGVVQCLMGILAGLVLAYFRRYKWMILIGACIRLIGYGVMLRLRGADNSTGELFAVQVIQGIGSGIIQTCLLVPAQISVPHAQMPQITALVVCFSILGGSIGSCISGGIYTNTFKPALWRALGDSGNDALVESLFNSITGVLPDWGTAQRDAVNHAYSDVMRYMTYAALGASIPSVILAWLVPNHRLPDKNNLVEE